MREGAPILDDLSEQARHCLIEGEAEIILGFEETPRQACQDTTRYFPLIMAVDTMERAIILGRHEVAIMLVPAAGELEWYYQVLGGEGH